LLSRIALPAARPGRPMFLGMVTVGLLLLVGLLWTLGCGSSGGGTTVLSDSTTSAQPTSTSGPGTPTSGSTGAIGSSTTAEPARLDKLTLVAPPGPMAIPLAYIAVNDRLADVADETELLVWENADQLKAMVAGGQGDFVTMPSNSSAIFYNKGLELQLLDISVWNITYLISADPEAKSFSDIEGESLVVSFQGSVPDVMFQYIATKEGLDPQNDFELQYAVDPTQAAQMLLSGKVDNAVLSEALATAAVAQSQSTDRPLYRAFAFDEAWARAGDWQASEAALSPIAGTVATSTVMDKPQVIEAFLREYEAAVAWMLANPEKAGELVETELPDLGLKAPLMTSSLQNITWEFTPAADARVSLEAFYTALSELSPEVIGGRLPDDGFYFSP
jgi:NitT/TauT family transport system substrate-binding protein